MQLSGKLHARVAITQQKSPPVPNNNESGWTLEQVLTFGYEKNVLSLPRIENTKYLAAETKNRNITNYFWLLIHYADAGAEPNRNFGFGSPFGKH
jgi:hypothetical protein